MPAAPSTLSAGVVPVAPTAFTDDGELDLDGQRRVLDCMIDQGVDGICILANYSEQFLLADAERETLLDACLRHVAGRVPVIVTCSHFSTRIAAERARRAAAAGAAMLMLMPPYHGAGLARRRGGHRRALRPRRRGGGHSDHGAGRAAVRRDARRCAFLARLAREVPLVRYFKIEVPGAAAKLRALIAAGGAAIAGPFDGEESITLMADLDAGATGTMSERAAARPHPAGADAPPGRAARRGRRGLRPDPAAHQLREPPVRAARHQDGDEGRRRDRERRTCAIRCEPLHPATRAGLLELAREAAPLALRWGR